MVGPALLVGVLLCGLAAIGRFDGTRQAAIDLAASVFAVAYIGGSLAVLALLRLSDAAGATDRGLFLLVATIAIVKAGDTGAYTVGRLIGRRKLAPRLSPGKTWEGAAGAVVFACTAGLFLFLAIRPENAFTQKDVLHLGGWLLASVALAAAGMIGDLVESLLKRSAGVKDSSTWMPGFGGVLDVLDSLLLAAPVAYGLAVVGVILP
jgi:phosphatidate cytidylyltransferase